MCNCLAMFYSREVFWYRFCNEFDTYQKSRIDLNEK